MIGEIRWEENWVGLTDGSGEISSSSRKLIRLWLMPMSLLRYQCFFRWKAQRIWEVVWVKQNNGTVS
jgi:hypothetical protein